MKLLTALAIVMALHIPVAARAQGRTVPACQGTAGYAAAFSSRRTFLLRPDWMSATKARGAQDPTAAVAWQEVFSRADYALAGPTYSVIDKTRVPPSGDKHDYLSMGPYWWPDATRPNGEPYVRRDGLVNPERDSNAFDTAALEAMSESVEALALAYYFSDDARYARKAAELLRVWFLEPRTRMNPNASFAQGVPGRTAGRAEGVLDTFRLIRVVEGIGLLAPAKVLSDAEQTGLERWFGDYVTWMQRSPTGQEERDAGNNHALWYDHQLVHYALFARREPIAREVVSSFAPRRLAKQIDPDGKLPRELERTRAWHYTVFALRAAAGLAELGRCFHLDLWHATANGRSLKAAIDFILPYIGREQDFPYPDLKAGATEASFELFARAAWAYGDLEYRHAAAKLGQYHRGSKINLTIAPYAPQ
jgi:hypothetical protein